MPPQSFSFPNVAALPPGFWKWPHLHPAKEWACKGTGKLVVVPEFMDLFEKLRKMYGRPLIVTSGYRSPEHNLAVAETGANGPHTTGCAVDIQVYGEYAYDVAAMAFALGFTGFGFSQKGDPARRFLHLDTLTKADGHPRPMIWTY